MTEKLQQTIKEELAKLPKEKQEAINAVDWVKISEEIGRKLLIDSDETNNLQVEILLVLTGRNDFDDFTRSIEDEVGTSAAEAENIAGEVFEKIFAPIAQIGIENIKKGDASKNPNYEQSIDFILSGGDYSAFIEKKEGKTIETDDQIVPPMSNSRITDIKNKFTI